MASDLIVDRSIATILGVVGMSILLLCWKLRSERIEPLAPVGWLLTGFYFFNETGFYIAHDDIVLTVISILTLPGAAAIAFWERRVDIVNDANAL
ncbi:MAG: hypothetical protein HOM47_01910, partial [Euryarchaeota archaeon]|nr:hypothetical protein [Euryarchaeota archaeon]